MTDLDFSGLMNIGADTSAPASAPTNSNDQETEQLSYELNQMKKKHAQVLEGYRELQDSKKATNSAKTAFIRHLEAGDKDIHALLVDAIDIIGTATHDTAFTNASKRHLSDQL